MSNFKACMQELADAFERLTRDNGARFYTLRDSAPDWMTAVCRDAHMALDGRFPDDWIYEAVYGIATDLADAECEDSDAAQDASCEICDSRVDIYTADLTRWLASHLGNVALCDEARDEGLIDPEQATLTDHIKLGQYLALQRIAGSVIASVDNEASRRDALADEPCPEVIDTLDHEVMRKLGIPE